MLIYSFEVCEEVFTVMIVDINVMMHRPFWIITTWCSLSKIVCLHLANLWSSEFLRSYISKANALSLLQGKQTILSLFEILQCNGCRLHHFGSIKTVRIFLNSARLFAILSEIAFTLLKWPRPSFWWTKYSRA
jgi:hypothetical protein